MIPHACKPLIQLIQKLGVVLNCVQTLLEGGGGETGLCIGGGGGGEGKNISISGCSTYLGS